MKKIFAIDFGASGGKCFVGLFDGEDFRMEEVHRFPHDGVSFFIPDANGGQRSRDYWDIVKLYDNIIEGLHAFKREYGDEIDSIGVDTWGADGQFITKDGDLLGLVYCYRDHRLDSMIEEVKSKVDPETVYSITGIHFQPFNLSNQLLWFVENRPYLLDVAASFLPISSIFYYLLGNVKMVDSSWASITQLMDSHTKEWSELMFNELGLPIEMMPAIVEPGTVVGELSDGIVELVGLKNKPSLVATASHDTASAFASAPIDDPDESLIISSGTWSLVGKLIPEPITTAEAAAEGLSNEGGIGNVRFLRNCMGTWILQELRRAWAIEDGEETSWKVIEQLVNDAPEFFAFIDPDDPSFYNPKNMEDAILSFCSRTGQNVPEDRGTTARIVYESLALKYRNVNERISKVSRTVTKQINIVGGGSRDVTLNQFTADCSGLPVVAGPVDGTAVGNIMSQALGIGILDSILDAQKYIRQAFDIKVFQPFGTGKWDKAYERFVGFLAS